MSKENIYFQKLCYNLFEKIYFFKNKNRKDFLYGTNINSQKYS